MLSTSPRLVSSSTIAATAFRMKPRLTVGSCLLSRLMPAKSRESGSLGALDPVGVLSEDPTGAVFDTPALTLALKPEHKQPCETGNMPNLGSRVFRWERVCGILA